MKRKLNVTIIIEKDEDGYFIASVPELKSCYTQAKTLEELIPRIKEVIELCIEEQGVPEVNKVLVGVQQVEVSFNGQASNSKIK